MDSTEAGPDVASTEKMLATNGENARVLILEYSSISTDLRARR